MAVGLVVSERVISQVITHQFNSAEDATKTNNSVEISGFGKFIFNKSKAVRHVEKLEKIKPWLKLFLVISNIRYLTFDKYLIFFGFFVETLVTFHFFLRHFLAR